jgi:DNA repair protein RadC
MKIASIAVIKKELNDLPKNELVAICLRLAKSKKEAKELLNYLLFEASDEEGYVKSAKQDIIEGFDTINLSSFYLAKKTIRKVLRITNKHIKFSTSKETEVELLIFFCESFNALNLPLSQSVVMTNLYNNVLKKIDKATLTLHEDLQYDYEERVDILR